MPLDATGFDLSDVPPREDGAVRAIVLYDPFNPRDRQFIDLEWSRERTVADYLGDLEGNWLVLLNGREVKSDEWATATVTPDEVMVLAQLPRGGDNSVFKMILMIAVVVAAAYFGGPLAGAMGFATTGTAATIASASIMIAGSFLVNMLLPDAKPPQQEVDSDSSRSYGLDGAKGTSREEVPVPIVYGEFRMAGNRINVHLENAPDGLSQTYYAQYAVSEGPIESITDFEINNQPISAFQHWETQARIGTLDQSPIPWFEQTVVPYFDGRTITETPITYNTQGEVEKIRLDIVFPNGLAAINSKDGKRHPHSTAIYASCRNLATDVVYPIRIPQWHQATLNGAGQTSFPGKHMRITVRAVYQPNYSLVGYDNEGNAIYDAAPNAGVYDYTLVVKDANGVVLLNKHHVGSARPSEWRQADGSDEAGTIWGQMLYNGDDFVYEVSGDGEPYFIVEFTNNSGANALVTIPSLEVLTLSDNTVITRAERTAVRVSLTSEPLPRGYYQVSVQRSPLIESDYILNDAALSDVNEIIVDPVAYVRTATYAIKVKLTEQLSNEPNVTALVKGRRVRIYDANGGYGDKIWSNNPADVVLDMLLSDDWERKFSPARIDFPAFVRWRQFCAANNLTFNGVFDGTTNVWDALMAVCRVGRANLVVAGTKWSVVLEAPSEPVMIFGDHNIIKGSFKNEWFGREGRANRIEVQYYDRTDRNKRKSVFAVDDVALGRGEAIRDSSINLIGVDNAAQAQKEADLQLRINQRIVQGCKFRAHLDALGCLPGDVVIVQHSMPAWGWSSRIKAIDESGLNLAITLENPLMPVGGSFERSPGTQALLPEGDWRVLISRPAIMRAEASVLAVSGAMLTVQGVHNPAGDPTAPYVRRIVFPGLDLRVLDVTFLPTSTVYTLDRPATGVTPGMTAQLWTVDALLQGGIVRPSEWDDVVTLSSWPNTVDPEVGDHIIIGRTTTLGKKFRIKRFRYASDQERELELVEYDPWVYEPSGNTPAPNASELQSSALHVVGLAADAYSRPVENGTTLYYARATWAAPLNDLWGHAGAKVYVSRDFGDFVLHETVALGRYESTVEASIGETVRFKVVATVQDGTAAPFASAPIASVLVRPMLAPPDPPTDLTAIAGPEQVALYWTPPAEGLAPAYYQVYSSDESGLVATATPHGRAAGPFYVATGLTVGAPYWFWVRAFSTTGMASTLVGPVSATPIAAGLGPNEYAIEKVSALPTGLGLADKGRVFFLTETDGGYLGDRLYRWNGTGWVAEITSVDDLPDGSISNEKIENITAEKIEGQLNTSHFSTSLRPPERVSVMPTSGNFQGRLVYLLTNDSASFPGTVFVANKLYRWTGTAWTAEVKSEDIDSRGLDIRDSFGNVVFGSNGQIRGDAYVNLNGNNVLISTIAANSLVASVNHVGEFATAPTQAQLGENWRQNAIYRNTTDSRTYVLTGDPLGWVVYLADGQAFNLVVESTNGTVFRRGQSQTTTLKARLFKNGAEVTEVTPEAWFRWRRVSAIAQSPPNDDATWNAAYSTGYRQVSINVDDVYARATFFCDIISP